jgi:hypothetical protein
VSWACRTAVSRALVLAAVTACAPPRLVADPTAPAVHTARLAGGDIVVRAEVGGKKPTESLPRNLTPIKITITNTTGRGIHVDLEEILLSGKDGAIQSVRIEDIHLWRPEPTVGLLPGAPPVLPLVSTRAMRNLRLGSPEYFTLVRGKHPEKKLVEQSALQSGYIESGQTISGYVYFEQVFDADQRVKLQVRVRSGAQSGTLTDTAIPFAVEE